MLPLTNLTQKVKKMVLFCTLLPPPPKQTVLPNNAKISSIYVCKGCWKFALNNLCSFLQNNLSSQFINIHMSCSSSSSRINLSWSTLGINLDIHHYFIYYMTHFCSILDLSLLLLVKLLLLIFFALLLVNFLCSFPTIAIVVARSRS